jgi:hypothetical protein
VIEANKTVRSNGERFVTLPHGRNPIAQVAKQKVKSAPPPRQGGAVIDPTIRIKANPGSISINWSIQDVKIIWDDYQAPVIRIDPKPYINVELAQEARVEFKVVEQSIPPEAGRMIDAEA